MVVKQQNLPAKCPECARPILRANNLCQLSQNLFANYNSEIPRWLQSRWKLCPLVPDPKPDLQLKHFKGGCNLSIVNVMTGLTQIKLQKCSQCQVWWAESIQLLGLMDGESSGEPATPWLGLYTRCAPLHGNQMMPWRKGLGSCKLTIRTKYQSKCLRTYKLQSSKGHFGHIFHE